MVVVALADAVDSLLPIRAARGGMDLSNWRGPDLRGKPLHLRPKLLPLHRQ